MRQILLFLFFLLVQNSFSQTLLKGKVVSEASNLDGIHVINLSNKKNTLTENSGFFSILAKPSDTLMFSGVLVKGLQIVLKPTDFSENLLFIRLKPQVNQLDEVIIKNYSEINAVSLGIVPKSVKSYTPAQRKLRTASAAYPNLYAGGMAGGSVGLDPLLNAISGRTAMLKKEVAVETREKLQEKLDKMYEEIFFVETLKIPVEYIKGFQIFTLDDEKLVNALKAKNTTLTTFLLGELAEKYKQMVFPEKN
ncbi:hypothetical protein [Flavobacterium humi]|uniref:Carboxypeptidase-like regulatory domain-containing protein n=1 Tax=Flavobacterium humi TaxID=2562683 RepID=A0A4Z0L9Q8_9FLAO|nr:hypothetical protein [Flavobacterium humi]TGD57743.1 hypothetical protein E4635_11240 [Flavobacterium humi]